MAVRTDVFDLGRLSLASGEGRRLELAATIEPFSLGGQEYAVTEHEVPVVVDVSKMTGGGFSLRLRFVAQLSGPCVRCLAGARPEYAVDAREVDQPGGGDELSSPYVTDQELDLRSWARDALALAMPAQILCRDDCAGLCPECGKDLNAEPHEHERPLDPRWSKLRSLLEDAS